MPNLHRVIGIDLGTTYSVVAAYNYDRQDVKVIPNRQGENTTPSVVYVSKEGNTSVGKAAKEKLERDPGGVIFEVKRLMGHQDDRGGKKRVRGPGGQEHEPEAISALILKELKSHAERVIGEPVHDAVITVPAYFQEPQKNATREAAKLAGLNPRYIMNEPTAAAVAYAADGSEPQNFIVYDFGGGTFDVSIVRVKDEKSVDVLGTGGDSHLGGGDIDERLVKWVLGKLKQDQGRDFSGDSRFCGRLRMKAEQVKINLCNEGSAQEFFVAGSGDSPEVSYTLEPAQFDEFVAPLVARTIEQVEVAMASAAKQHELTWDDVEAFIMVGGSSKIPAVARALKERFSKPLRNDLNPDEIVGIGAARMARNYAPSTGPELGDKPVQIDKVAAQKIPGGLGNTNVKDVVSHTLGIGLLDDLYDALIPKDTVIPHKVKRQGYTTSVDNQTNIFVPVFQGDNPKASLNTKIGEVIIDGLTPEPKGGHRFEITFGLDADGVFKGEIFHVNTKKVTDVKLDRGKDQITIQKIMDLREQVASGTLPVGQGGGAAGAKPNPVVALVEQANALLAALPPERQRELMQVLTKVTRAQAQGSEAERQAAIAELTMFVTRNQAR